MTNNRRILWVLLALVLPMRLPAQQVLRLPTARQTAFVARVGGIRGAREMMLAKPTSQVVREAVADTLVAIANLGSETPELSATNALAALLLTAGSDMPGVSEIGRSRFIRMALDGNTLLVRMNAVTMLGTLDDHAKGASALKKVATSRSDVAKEAVRILGLSYGPIGVSTLREIFDATSAIDPEAAGWVGHFAQRYKWTR